MTERQRFIRHWKKHWFIESMLKQIGPKLWTSDKIRERRSSASGTFAMYRYIHFVVKDRPTVFSPDLRDSSWTRIFARNLDVPAILVLHPEMANH
jgi:hypothetical protein